MKTLRAPIGRALGLGSANEGLSHWWWQRLTATALVPLALWFVISIASLSGADYAAVSGWMSSPWNAGLLVVFIATLFHHAQLGVQVVLEDYVTTEWLRVASIVLVKFVAVLFAVVSIVAVLHVALGG